MSFAGKVVLITGAQQGIGRATALAFAAAGAEWMHIVDLDGLAHQPQVLPTRLAVLQVQRDGVNAGLRLRFCHHQSAAGAATRKARPQPGQGKERLGIAARSPPRRHTGQRYAKTCAVRCVPRKRASTPVF